MIINQKQQEAALADQIPDLDCEFTNRAYCVDPNEYRLTDDELRTLAEMPGRWTRPLAQEVLAHRALGTASGAPLIRTPENRDALTAGAIAVWMVEDHPGYYDNFPADLRDVVPDFAILRHVGNGWVTVDEPLWVRPEDQLPPLPWRLLRKPDAS